MGQRTRLEADRRADLAWSARVAGSSWEQAAVVSGYTSGQNAYRAVLRRRGELPVSQRDDLRDIWRQRLEALWRQAALDAMSNRPGAITAAVRVAGTAIQLDGLAEPVRLDFRVEPELTALLEALLPAPQVVVSEVVSDDGTSAAD